MQLNLLVNIVDTCHALQAENCETKKSVCIQLCIVFFTLNEEIWME